MPNDGSTGCLDELVLRARRVEPDREQTASTSTTTETASADHFANCRPVAGSSITTTAPSMGTAHSTVSQGRPEVTTAAPPGSRRRPGPRRPASTAHTSGRIRSAAAAARRDCAPTRAASPSVTRRRRPCRRSTTRSLVTSWPGRMNSASLKASPYRSLRAATVSADTSSGAVSGTVAWRTAGRRSRRRRRRPTSVITVTTQTGHHVVCSRGSPTTGSSQCSSVPPMASSAPEADRADGQHDHRPRHHLSAIRADGCRASSAASPKNVISITRVM